MARASKWKTGQGMADVPVHVENYNGTLVVTVGKIGKYIDVEIERDEIKSLMGLSEPCGWDPIKPMQSNDDIREALGLARSEDLCSRKCPACVDGACSRPAWHLGNHSHWNADSKEWIEF